MKNILIALELEEKNFSDKIVKSATQLAKAFGAKCWIVHIAAPEPDFVGYEVGPQYIRDMLAEDLKEEHKIVQAYADEIKKQGLNAEGLMVQGPTEEMILKEVEKLDIDLMILGNKKHGLLYSTFVGSVTDDLIHDLDIPVYLVPQ
ncbi:MAG: universal stress protein [Vicingaceae bacterium]